VVYLQTDYVVVGTGSAGSVLANRLSVDPGSHVVVLEAGPRDKDTFIHIPAAFGNCSSRRAASPISRPGLADRS
jgi:choline dehydrogenase-like flavoprotein